MPSFEVAFASVLVITIFSSTAIVGQETGCYEARDPGPCKASITRWYWSQNVKQCMSFKYGGCKGTRNNYQTKKDCDHKCKCKQPIEAGGCNSNEPSYGWNSAKNDCVNFTYKGCGGNSNRYGTRAKCMEACK
ncbi:hypothetical protein FGIG_11101 [Fasciola gigantica]|uniref:BPTI/Kunitz inhibitor domain-containing protein n=1 Tax=Fasciola gigantica TaxID=46835 RepID=A0A504ZEF7_FASGI|nr:hypothetical protein FGIG_11101 [Fasciola gigantica]